MLKKNISINEQAASSKANSTVTNSTFELVRWPLLANNTDSALKQVHEKVFALQTNRLPLIAIEQSQLAKKAAIASVYDSFNLGLHVDDDAKQVNLNRQQLTDYLNLQVIGQANASNAVKVQWLEQVHGNNVAEITNVTEHAITADASITRQQGVALAIMTADCLPILLTNTSGSEVAAIHGGWRPLAANIIAKTIEKMHSSPADIIAWLGPCIGNTAFEVGDEVKACFIQQAPEFANAFFQQGNGKHLADLQLIASLQLKALGVNKLSSLPECTYQQTNKYYSYRKEQITGRMASVILLR